MRSLILKKHAHKAYENLYLNALEVDKLNKNIEHISNAQLISIENMVGKEKVSNEEQLYLSLQTEIYSHIS